MIDTSNLGKAEFVRVILDRDLRNIFKAQLLAVSKNKRLKGKELRVVTRRKQTKAPLGHINEALSSPNYFIQSQGEKFITESTIPVDMRFYDMRSKQNMQIYNRIVWGILYNNAYPDIKFNYGKEVKDLVGDALREAFK